MLLENLNKIKSILEQIHEDQVDTTNALSEVDISKKNLQDFAKWRWATSITFDTVQSFTQIKSPSDLFNFVIEKQAAVFS